MTRISSDPFSGDPFSQPVSRGRPKSFDFAQPLQGPSEEDEGFFDLAFGFIPTINVGTGLGIKNTFGRLALDILLDPITLVSAFFTGGATLAGKSALATEKLGRLAFKGSTVTRKLSKLADISSAEKVKGLEKILNISAKGVSNPSLVRDLNAAVRTGDLGMVNGILKKIRKSEIDPSILKKLPNQEEFNIFRKAFDLDKKLELRNISRIEKGLDPLTKLPLAPTRSAQAIAGQRQVLGFKVPFTQIEKTLIQGERMWSQFDQIFPYTKFMANGTTKLKDLTKTVVEQRSIDMGEHLASSIIKKAKRNDAFSKLVTIGAVASKLPVEELKKLAFFYREGKVAGTGLPAAPDLLQQVGLGSLVGHDLETFAKLKKFVDEQGLTKAMDYSDNVLNAHYDTLLQTINQSKRGTDIKAIEGYIQHVYDLDDVIPAVSEVASKFATNGGFLQKRSINTMFTAMSERGLLPKNLDVFDLAQKYHTAAANIITSSTAIETIRKSKLMRVLDEGVAQKDKFVKLFTTKEKAKRLKLADEGWVALDDINIAQKIGATTDVWMPLEVKNALKVMIDKPFGNAALKAMEQFNAVSKSVSLGASFFHSAALLESLFAVSGFKGLAFGLKQGAGIPLLSQGLQKAGFAKKLADFESRQILEAAKYMNVEMSADVRIGALNKAIDNIGNVARKVPGGDVATKFLGKAVEFQNEALWETLHVPSKVFGFNQQVSKLIKKFPDANIEEIKKTAGAFMDDAFGGLNWEKLMVTPKMKQLSSILTFAPDWTLANARIFGRFAKAGVKRVKSITSGVPLTDIEKAQEGLATAYWGRAAFGLFASTNLLNQAFTGRWMWENPPGHTTDIAIGFNEELGKEEYVKLGKQLREPIRWMTEPFKIGGAKLAPGVKEVIEQFTGVSPGGFPTEFGSKGFGPQPTFFETIPLRIKNVASKFVPFSIGGNSFFMALPKSTFSTTQAINGVVDAINDGDRRGVNDIMKFAEANGLNASFIRGQVKQRVENADKFFAKPIKRRK